MQRSMYENLITVKQTVVPSNMTPVLRTHVCEYIYLDTRCAEKDRRRHARLLWSGGHYYGWWEEETGKKKGGKSDGTKRKK